MPFEVEPSGKIISGDLVERPSWISSYRSIISYTVFSFASGVPPLGQNSPSAAETPDPTNGIDFTSILARKLTSANSAQIIRKGSDPDPWLDTYVGAR